MQQLEFFALGVTGDVNLGDRMVNHVRAALDQLVDRAVNQFLVAGNGVRGHDHGVAFADFKLAVAAPC